MKKLILFIFLTISAFGLKIEDSNKKNEEEKIIYKDMLAYMLMTNDPSQYLALGSLYATGSSIKDSTGAVIKQDIFLAEKYLLKAANMGNNHALTVLGGFILLNNKMQELDPKLIKAEGYLNKAYKSGDLSAGVLLSNLYFSKNNYIKGLEKLTECAERKDSSAQLALALLFKEGMADSKGKIIFEKNMRTAEFYLNKACTNEHKSEKVMNFCSDDKLTIKSIK